MRAALLIVGLLSGCAVIPWPGTPDPLPAAIVEVPPAPAAPTFCAIGEPTVCEPLPPRVERIPCDCPKPKPCAAPPYVLTTLLDEHGLRLLIDQYRNAMEACSK